LRLNNEEDQKQVEAFWHDSQDCCACKRAVCRWFLFLWKLGFLDKRKCFFLVIGELFHRISCQECDLSESRVCCVLQKYYCRKKQILTIKVT
jgi:hypothetical protein